MSDHAHCPGCGTSVPFGGEHQCPELATKLGPGGVDRGFHKGLRQDMHVGGLGNRLDDLTLAVRQPTTKTAERCLMEAKDALDLFVERNNGYGERAASELGLKGQYADINRKVIKLKRWLWEGKQEPVTVGSEGVIEVCQDLIGHLLLTIDMYKAGGGPQ